MAFAKCPQCKQVAHFQTGLDEEVRRRDRYEQDEDGYLRLDLCLICGWGGIQRHVDMGGYFNRELAGIREDWPRMGRECSHCNRRIPRFIDIDPEATAGLRKRVKSGETDEVARVVRELTGCPAAWAELWVQHPDGPIAPPPVWKGPPCSNCGRPLRSAFARQCFECGMDWHDPDNIRRLE